MTTDARPLSPHLGVYRLPCTAWISITHRFTGILLSAGMLLLALVPVAAACGPEAYHPLHAFLSSFIGRVSLWLWILSFVFHLCHGVRHILWDVGVGYEKLALNRYAVLEVTAALLITATAWIFTHNIND